MGSSPAVGTLMKSPWYYNKDIPCVCWWPVVPISNAVILHHWLMGKCPRHSPLPEYMPLIEEYIDANS